MTPTQNDKTRTRSTGVIREPSEEQAREPRPWTAPDFVERSTCAEIGAYAFQEK